jgi:phosphate transport system protein
MDIHLEQELEQIKIQIMNMFALAERALDKSLQALVNRDSNLAQQVLDEDKQINKMEVDIEDLCLSTLALSQPVARDLRFVVGCSRIANSLERVGDQATNIAERAIALNSKPEIPIINNIQSLSDIVHSMLKDVITAFTNLDEDLSSQICEKDSQADELNVKIIKKLVDYMSCENVIIERAVHTILISNFLERVGDLATNIAEHIVFISKGLNVKHSCQFDGN